MEYEVYIEVFHIQEWRGGAVYRTESSGCKWMSKKVVDSNLPNMTNVLYVAANDEFAQNNMTIRRKQA
jgi:hypothetical protein